jgi:diguanylate cyclase (GGDEF)-like protein
MANLVRLASSTSHEEARAALDAIASEVDAEASGLAPVLDSLVARVGEIAALRRLAGTDALTGLANRRRLEETLARELARASRRGGRLAVLLLDLDGLKRLNDDHGHSAGDQAIVSVARACQQTLRAADLAARVGGDEFAVLLSDTDDAGARVVAERLRSAIEDTVVAGRRLRVSIGIACGIAPFASPELLLASADAAMYEDKRARSIVTELVAA